MKDSLPWQWGKWDWVARPKEQGGLGIIDPVVHAEARCAKLLVTLASQRQEWEMMVWDVVSQEGKWVGCTTNFLLMTG